MAKLSRLFPTLLVPALCLAIHLDLGAQVLLPPPSTSPDIAEGVASVILDYSWPVHTQLAIEHFDLKFTGNPQVGLRAMFGLANNFGLGVQLQYTEIDYEDRAFDDDGMWLIGATVAKSVATKALTFYAGLGVSHYDFPQDTAHPYFRLGGMWNPFPQIAESLELVLHSSFGSVLSRKSESDEWTITTFNIGVTASWSISANGRLSFGPVWESQIFDVGSVTEESGKAVGILLSFEYSFGL